MNSILAGATSGLIATAPMSAVMLALHEMLPPEQQWPTPPKVVTENAVAQTGLANDLSQEQLDAMTVTAHFGYGAAAGAAYAAVGGATRLPPVVEGSLFGFVVWAGSYFGLMPSVRLYPSAKDETAPRNGMMIAAHLAWGATLGVLFHSLSQRDNGR